MDGQEKNPGQDAPSADAEQLRQALHELRVHQIELEMQNEELRRAQLELDAARARYFDLYDLAPVGYCTVCEAGQILEANLTAATLLGLARSALVKRPISSFIVAVDQDTYYLHRHQLLATGTPQSCELRMMKSDGTPFWAQLAATVARASNGEPVHRVVLSDITQHRRMQAELLASQAQLRESALRSQTILDNMVDGVITINAQGLMQSFNKAACGIFGYALDEVLGRNVAMLMPAPVRSHHDGYLQNFKSTGDTRFIGQMRELEGQRKDGSLFPISLSVSQISHSGQPIFIGIVRDITRHRQDMEKIRQLAFYDPLTGLPNRRLLMDRVEQGMLTSKRNGQHGALMFLDLDHFKQLNDTLGHDVGDLLLQQVASRIKACVREGDSVGRLGGDEFVVLLEALSAQAHEAAPQAEAVARQILAALGQPYNLLGHAHASTPSIGVVVFMEGHETIDELLKKADLAMYQAKSAGRNTMRFFKPDMQAKTAAAPDRPSSP